MSHTFIIIIITVVVSMLAWQNNKLFDTLIFHAQRVKQGQIYRLLTHGFIHADGMHLLFNMITLYFFGRATENFFNQYVNGYGFIIFYLFAIIASIIPSYLNNKNNLHYRSLGASGGVSAILFTAILINPWSILLLYFIPMPAIVFAIGYVAYSVYANKKGSSNINHSAHLWGAGFGIVASIAINPNLLVHFLYMLMHPKF
ncbi:MAG: rhomboid family intramembrane serine protease [Moraxellaceae bacterium]|nr:rhomboid family intramembrane serine protease [Moraxellaceae bacterium]